jgi:glyoxylase-like metal-dependent hydrolase (beta-lactamase superfamily II)
VLNRFNVQIICAKDFLMKHTAPICIDLDQPSLEGFRQFISAWLVRGERGTFLVDPGPLSTIPRLLAELGRLGVEHLDYVLLTHIHIDHAGGAGALLAAYPEARVICHPEGIRHLVAPGKLWEGSRKVLGTLAEVYGPIAAVPEERIAFAEEIPAIGVRAFPSPGHASHHLCFLQGDLLFAGEVAGVRSELEGEIYMRPATPPRFILKVALASIEAMIALRPKAMVFGHYGLVEDAQVHLEIARNQLLLWVQGVAVSAAVPKEEREAALYTWLLEHDDHYRHLPRLAPDIQVRERYFLANTLRGMAEYVDALPAEERRALAAGGQG